MKSRQRPQLIDRVDVINGRAHVTVWRSIASQLVEIEGLPTIAQRYDRLLHPLPLPLPGAEGLTGPPDAPRRSPTSKRRCRVLSARSRRGRSATMALYFLRV